MAILEEECEELTTCVCLIIDGAFLFCRFFFRCGTDDGCGGFLVYATNSLFFLFFDLQKW